LHRVVLPPWTPLNCCQHYSPGSDFFVLVFPCPFTTVRRSPFLILSATSQFRLGTTRFPTPYPECFVLFFVVSGSPRKESLPSFLSLCPPRLQQHWKVFVSFPLSFVSRRSPSLARALFNSGIYRHIQPRHPFFRDLVDQSSPNS